MSADTEENQMSPLPDTAGTVKCGSCKSRHFTRDEVLHCYVAAGKIENLFICGWQYEGAIATGDPDEPYYRGVVECDAIATIRADGSGFDCTAGHEHTNAQARWEQGWDYAEDAMEAAYLAKYGTEPRTMAHGAPWTEPLPAV
jgi:hypothetical protein